MLGLYTRNFALSIAVPMVFSLIACADLDDFEVEISDEAVIDGQFMARISNPLGFMGNYQDLNLSTSKEFTDQGIDPNDVDAIFVKSVQIVATSPADIRLDSIIESVAYTIKAPGQQPQSVATAELPDGVELRVINCNVESDINLKPYATSDNMSISADLALKQTPGLTTTLKTTIKLLVDIDVF